jgi:signal transduction histidine kinase
MKLLQYFAPASQLHSEKEVRQESLVIRFTLISILFAIGYYFMSFFNGFLMARYVMVIVTVIFIGLLYAYKFQVLTLLVMNHIFVMTCWLVVFVLSLASNGIHSFVTGWVSLIPIMALVLISSTAAWVWSGIGITTVLTFLIIEPGDWMPATLLMDENVSLTTALHIGLLLLILTLTYIFDRQQAQLVEKIEFQNQELQQSKGEISTRNAELMQSQLEISQQHEQLSQQNKQLQEAREIIETQHHILIQKNEGLELEIQQRTKELVEYNQQLEQFAFISSHNLRAPIARILGLGNLLALTNDKEDERIIKKELVQSTQQLDRVVKDLNTILDVRKSSNTMNSQLNVKKEIELVLTHYEKEISVVNAKVLVEVAEVPVLHTTKPYFSSIITNLVSNAIKYRKQNETLTLSISAALQHDYAVFTIQDNGLGFDINTSREKLFTLYSRFHEGIEGKGLGLYMVKTQLDAMGGKIEVDSEVGVGTTFKVYIKTGVTD